MIEIDTRAFLADLYALREIGRFRTGVHRPTFSPEDMESRRWLMAKLEACGLAASIDGIGNVLGRHRGPGPHLLVGSHIETQNEAGWLDGALGVVAGVALARAGLPVDVVAFADEEGHFSGGFLGSRSAIGDLTEAEIDEARTRTDGTPLRAALEAAGLAGLPRMRLDPGRYRGFLEMHIEQGPALEAAGSPVGFVTAISGSFRYRKAACFGRYGHSGAVARSARSDAVFALADLITGLDALWGTLEAEGCPTTITLGEVATDPVQHAFAKIPGEVRFCLDVRSTEPVVLDRVEAALAERVAAIEAARGVRFVLGERTGSTPARMSAALVEALSGHARRLGMPFRTMASGAGHDTATLAGQGVPSTMIFIRNQNGSHNPDEAMRIEDLCAAATLVAHLVAEA